MLHCIPKSDSELICEAGEICFKNNKLDEAMQHFNHAIQLSPVNAQAYLLRGYVYLKQNKVNAAMADFTLAIQHNPHSPHAYLIRGKYYEIKGKHLAALTDYLQILDIYPDTCPAHFAYARAVALKSKGMLSGAMVSFTLALQHRPGLKSAITELFNLLSDLHEGYDLARIKKPDLYNAIKSLPTDKQMVLLAKCKDEDSALGEIIARREGVRPLSMNAKMHQRICKRFSKLSRACEGMNDFVIIDADADNDARAVEINNAQYESDNDSEITSALFYRASQNSPKSSGEESDALHQMKVINKF